MFKHIENYLIIIVAALLGTLLFSECCYGFDIDASGNMVRTAIKFIEHPVYVTFIATNLVLCIVSLCYYKKYLMQLRLEVITFILLLIFNIIFTCDFFKMHKAWSYTIFGIFPLITMILTGIAIYKMVYPAGPKRGKRVVTPEEKAEAGKLNKVRR
jgi:uncharacterized membrane protein YoaK (UPF0700 family)